MKTAIRSTLLAALLIAAFAASVMAQATNGTLTLTPFRGSSAFVTGAAISATFNDSGRSWHEGTQGYSDPLGLKYRFEVRMQPGNIPCYVVQVEPTRLWFFMGWVPDGMTSVVISLRDPYANQVGTGPIIWTEVIPITSPGRAVPVLDGSAHWYAFTDARLHEVHAGEPFILPRNGLRFDLALFISNIGSVPLWVIQISRDGQAVLEALAITEYGNQARPRDNLQTQLNQLAVGVYSIRVYALDDPSIISNGISLTIQ